MAERTSSGPDAAGGMEQRVAEPEYILAWLALALVGWLGALAGLWWWVTP